MWPVSYPLSTNADQIPARNVYPTAPGSTLGTYATGPRGIVPTPSFAGSTPPATNSPAAPAASASGEPVRWWLVLVVMLVALMWTARHFGGEEKFSNLRLTFYNIFVVTLTAIIGITLFKVAAASNAVRNNLPALSDVILAA